MVGEPYAPMATLVPKLSLGTRVAIADGLKKALVNNNQSLLITITKRYSAKWCSSANLVRLGIS
jgi:hypothetical protein